MGEEFKRALAAMERNAAYREYCRDDIFKRLQRFELTSKERGEIVESLENNGFIDEERYSRAYVRDKSRLNKWGKKKIEWGLRAKRVERDIIAVALEEIDPEAEMRQLIELAESRVKNYKAGEESRRVRERLLRFLLSRGYDYQQSLTAVDGAMKLYKGADDQDGEF